MATSQNGYRANARLLTSVKRIPGTVRDIRLRRGNPGWLLRDFAAWFDKHIESIDHDGQLDDWGYAERPIRGSSTTLSNHASGTAIDLNALDHPLGVRGTFTREQAAAIRLKLRDYDGCIRWGGDYSGRPDEMHFEINRGLSDVRRVAKRIRQEDDMPSADEIAKAVWAQRDKVTGKRRSKLLRMAARSKKVARKNREVIRKRAGITEGQLDAVLDAIDELDDEDAAGE